MKTVFKTLMFVGFILFILVLDHVGQGVTFIREATALVGAPVTPVSVAGVARRTTRRAVASTAVVATSTATASAVPQSPAPAAPAPQAAPAAQPTAAPQSTAVPSAQSAPAPQQAAAPQQNTGQVAPTVPVGTVVPALPSGCGSVVADGISYFNCGDVFYKAAIQGSNLVYVAVEKPHP